MYNEFVFIQTNLYTSYLMIHVSLTNPLVSPLIFLLSTPPKYCPIAAVSKIELNSLKFLLYLFITVSTIGNIGNCSI